MVPFIFTNEQSQRMHCDVPALFILTKGIIAGMDRFLVINNPLTLSKSINCSISLYNECALNIQCSRTSNMDYLHVGEQI